MMRISAHGFINNEDHTRIGTVKGSGGIKIIIIMYKIWKRKTVRKSGRGFYPSLTHTLPNK